MIDPIVDRFIATGGVACIVGDKSGNKNAGHVYVMRQPNGLTSALIALPAEGFSPQCDYIDLGPCPEFDDQPNERK